MNHLRLLPGFTFYGPHGENALGWTNDFLSHNDTALVERNLVFAWLGAHYNTDFSTIENSFYNIMINMTQHASAPALLFPATMPYPKEESVQDEYKNARNKEIIQTYNKALRAYAKANHLPILEAEIITTNTSSWDGMHRHQRSNILLAQVFLNTVSEIMEEDGWFPSKQSAKRRLFHRVPNQ